jgi:hypothetical protein
MNEISNMNETEIPTPRTDAFFKRRIELYHHGLEPQDTMRDADFARQLERENAAMREIFPKVLEACQNGSGCLPEVSLWFLSGIPEEVRLVVDDLKQENAAMREVIKAAYEALEESAAKLAGWHGLYETQIGSDDYAAVLNAESIIAKLKPYLP